MRNAVIVAGMVFGDEGKGTMVDYLVRKHTSPLVVRYNGGAQCAHNVVLPNGVHHTYAQFGSGTFAGAHTYLSEHVLVDFLAMEKEAEELELRCGTPVFTQMHVDPSAILVTPYQVFANRLRETLRDKKRHGSTGMGIGETREDYLVYNLMVRAGWQPDVMLRGLRAIRKHKLTQFASCTPKTSHAESLFEKIEKTSPTDVLEAFLHTRQKIELISWPDMQSRYPNDAVVFEGAQGVLLDETHGTHPYNTWTDTTFRNALALCRAARIPKIEKIGVFRSYFTRHGNGPFPTESKSVCWPEPHNAPNPWMGNFRQGYFDYGLAKYALQIAPPTCVAVTHMDRVLEENAVEFLRNFERRLGVSVRYTSYGPTWRDKQCLTNVEVSVPA